MIRNQKPETRSQKPEGLPALRAEDLFMKTRARRALEISGFWFLASGFSLHNRAR
jgi:hypothetical protein